ncbi:hypothetical protein NEOLEDRAFT_1178094 [Neolentinus lepideus HHB14362 ss-1]|uniref:Uncharacterized protein n=1 Tax=Neolentinus lepideus HHB14362 ss-1 TaxID=1314782 RepID=A0A165T134_9AGAM|nr:hypothetical protein NEOLEDRAFT_1178094 [Neolentinus lepideus HHB14362 ss-1]
MPSEERPTRSIRSATNKANARPVETRRPARSSLGGGDNVASSSTTIQHDTVAPRQPPPPAPDHLDTQTIIAHLPDDEDGSPLSPTTSALLPDEEDAEFMDFESTPTPLRVHNPPTLISTALGSVPQRLQPPLQPPTAAADNRDTSRPDRESSPNPEIRLVFNSQDSQPTYAMVTANPPSPSGATPASAQTTRRSARASGVPRAPLELPTAPAPQAPQPQTTALPAVEPTNVPPLPEPLPMAAVTTDAAQNQTIHVDPPEAAPLHNAIEGLAIQPVLAAPNQHPGDAEAPVNPNVAALVDSYQEELQAINTHTAHQITTLTNSATSAFTPPPPGGFPMTHRNSGAELFRNIAPAQLTALFSQPTPVLIVLPHNWNGRDLATRGAEAAAHILSTAVAYSRAISNDPTDDIQVTTATPANPSGPNQPRVFFLRNLSQTVFTSMLERRVISHYRSTFQVFPVPVPEPDHAIVLALAGFTSRDTQGIREAIANLLQSPSLRDNIREIIERELHGTYDELTEVANNFGRSISLQCIDTRAPGGLITPRYIMFARRPPGITSNLWFQLRHSLYNTTYSTPLFGTGRPVPFTPCSLCHCLTHSRGMCPFTNITGWNGPVYASSWITQDEPRTTHYAMQSQSTAPDRGRGRGYGRGRGRGQTN